MTAAERAQKAVDDFAKKFGGELGSYWMLEIVTQAITDAEKERDERAAQIVEQEAERTRGTTMGDWLPQNLNRIADKIRD